MGVFILADQSSVVNCQLCHEKIVFVMRKEGGWWFPADVHQDTETGQWGYHSSGSHHKEITHLHQCGGNPEDATTRNGIKKFHITRMTEIKEKIDQIIIRARLIAGLGKEGGDVEIVKKSPEYQQLLAEYQEITKQARGWS